MLDDHQVLFVGLGLAAAAKYYMLYSIQHKVPKTAKKVGKVSRITLFPLKSATGVELDEALCTFNGLQHGNVKDR